MERVRDTIPVMMIITTSGTVRGRERAKGTVTATITTMEVREKGRVKEREKAREKEKGREKEKERVHQSIIFSPVLTQKRLHPQS